jgi:DNA topoisomerase-1
MAKDILIVESPTKAKTITKLVEDRLTVLSSKGHIKDLPKSRLAVDVEHNFTPEYIRIRGKGNIIKELRSAARGAKTIYLGCDPDREGEAIAYHIAEELDNKKKKRVKRVLFYEITKEGVQKGLDNPTEINQQRVNAHKARRVLDRLVGYMTSPLLWRILHRGLSAGRVQSVALRLLCEREREIQAFVPKKYWTMSALFASKEGKEFEAQLSKIGAAEGKIEEEAAVEKIKKELVKTKFQLSQVKIYDKHYTPAAPFTTSTMQQESVKQLHFTAKKAMFVAQQLFEGIELGAEATGLITYPRSDSVRVADDFIAKTREFIKETWNERYLPEAPRQFKDRKGAQAAHEAIRPTNVARTPESIKEFLTPDQQKLYTLVYNRFLASQMADSVYAAVDVEITGKQYVFRTSTLKQKFPGFEEVIKTEREEKPALPKLVEGDEVFLKELKPEEHLTQPPARYSEATLVKKLEVNGIGRPSTYAPIISTLSERGYINKDKGRLVPTELGLLVNDIIIPRFSDIFETGFTKDMEAKLDQIEAGKEVWQTVVKKFYKPFKKEVDKAEVEIEGMKNQFSKELDEKCPKCDKPLMERWGRFGRFIACSGFPDCRYSKPLDGSEPQPTEELCPKCSKILLLRSGRYGKFLACSGFPECKFTKPLTNLEKNCPDCGKPLLIRFGRGRRFLGCSGYPECRHTEPYKSDEQPAE